MQGIPTLVKRFTDSDSPFEGTDVIAGVLGFSLCCGLLCFTLFHITIIHTGHTTIEYLASDAEKRQRTGFENWQVIMGSSVWMWFLPLAVNRSKTGYEQGTDNDAAEEILLDNDNDNDLLLSIAPPTTGTGDDDEEMLTVTV
jgi:hypothetical protein